MGLGAGALMLLFTAIVTRDVLQNRRTTCSCFGRFSNENVSELTVARDLFLLVLAGLIVISPIPYLAVDALLRTARSAGPRRGRHSRGAPGRARPSCWWCWAAQWSRPFAACSAPSRTARWTIDYSASSIVHRPSSASLFINLITAHSKGPHGRYLAR